MITIPTYYLLQLIYNKHYLAQAQSPKLQLSN